MKKKSQNNQKKSSDKANQQRLKHAELLENFREAVRRISADVGIAPNEVTKAMFFSESGMTEWEIRRFGGYSSLMNLAFPKETEGSIVSGNRLISSFKRKLENKYGTEEFVTQEFLSSIEKIFDKNPIKYHKLVKNAKSSKKAFSRTIVAHLSDTHYGANIDTKEMGGLNQFNWTVASRRTALFAEQIAQYKEQYREDTELVLCINGDIIAGVIHDQEWFVDLLATQFAGTLSILTQMVGYLSTKFKSVRVECATGNHGRAMHKSNHGRATTHKWDSYESMIYVALQQAAKVYKNVKVNVPLTPYNIFEVLGHKFFLSHGDTVFNLGNPGKAINIASINQQINKLNASELVNDQALSGIIVGHVHTPTVQITDSGCALIVNGCLSGVDPFAQSIGIFSNNPTQQLFEATKSHAVGDIRFIQLKSADKRSDLDSIIEPFKGHLG